MRRSAIALLVLLIPIAALAQEPEQAQEPDLEQGWVEVARLLAEAEAHSRQWLQTQLAASVPELTAVDWLNRFAEPGVRQQGLAAAQRLSWLMYDLSEPAPGESEQFYKGLVSMVLERSRSIKKMLPDAQLSGFSVSAAFPPALDLHFEFDDPSSASPSADDPGR